MSFFDDDPLSPGNESYGTERERSRAARASSSQSQSREPSISGNSSFLDRLRSTVSPSPGPPAGQGAGRGQGQRGAGSRASNSIYEGESGGGSSTYNDHGLDLDDDEGSYSLGLGSGARGGRNLGEGEEGENDLNLELDIGDDYDELDDVRKLSKIWVKERGTPELMPWDGDLVDSILIKLEQQGKMVTTLRSDPQTSEEEHFKLVLVQTEIERVKYLVRSYVRTRLHKIEKHSYHITLTPSIHHLLSGAELSHAERYTELLHTHFQHSVLDSLPEWLRKMDDSYGDGLSMVSKPNRNIPVLVYCRKDCGEITLEGGERAALAKGTTHLVKYRLVDRWINLGWAEVL